MTYFSEDETTSHYRISKSEEALWWRLETENIYVNFVRFYVKLIICLFMMLQEVVKFVFLA